MRRRQVSSSSFTIFHPPFTVHHTLLPVIILAGGFGTRLQSVVDDRPKVLAEVAGKPFLEHLLARMAVEGVQDVVLSTGYLGEQVKAFVGALGLAGMNVQCVREPEPMGTGGALAFAAREAGISGPFVGMNGDTFFGGLISELIEAHHAAQSPKATIALARVESADRYGRVLFDEGGGDGPVQVTGFVEKGQDMPANGSIWINAGVYVLSQSALADAPEGERVSLERAIFPRLVEEGSLWAHRFPDAPFLDIGTPDDYARAAQMLA